MLQCLLTFSAQDFVSRETECAECLINAAAPVAMRCVARARMLAWKIQNNRSGSALRTSTFTFYYSTRQEHVQAQKFITRHDQSPDGSVQ